MADVIDALWTFVEIFDPARRYAMRKKETYLKHSVKNKLIIWFADLAFCTLLLFVLSPMSFAQEDNAGGNPALGEQIKQSIERALTSYQAEMEDLQMSIQKLESFQKEIIGQLKAYDVQSTIHGQLLLIRRPRQRDLENALRDNRLAIQNLNDKIETLRKNWEMESFSVQDSMDRIEQTRKQVGDIQSSWFSDAQKQQIESANRKLNRVFHERKELKHRYLIVYGDLLNQIQEVLEKKDVDREKLTRRIKEQRERILFQKQDLYRFISGGKIKEELRLFQDRLAAVFKPATWKGIAMKILRVLTPKPLPTRALARSPATRRSACSHCWSAAPLSLRRASWLPMLRRVSLYGEPYPLISKR